MSYKKKRIIYSGISNFQKNILNTIEAQPSIKNYKVFLQPKILNTLNQKNKTTFSQRNSPEKIDKQNSSDLKIKPLDVQHLMSFKNDIKGPEVNLFKNKTITDRKNINLTEPKKNLTINEIKNKVYNNLKTKNPREVFINWQNDIIDSKHELSPNDLYENINKLDIPINHNEVEFLIKSANKRNTNSLNYDEFKQLFIVNNKNLKTDGNCSINVNEDKKSPYIFNQNKLDNKKVFESQNYLKLRSLMKNKYPNFLHSMESLNKSNGKDNNTCDYSTFKKVLDTFRIPEKYKNSTIANAIYNEYKLPDKNLMDYSKFIDNCKNYKEPNDFFRFQNSYLNLLNNKLSSIENERSSYKNILQKKENRKQEYIQNVKSSKSSDKTNIKNKNETFSHYQPSFNYLNMIYKDKNNNLNYNQNDKHEYSRDDINQYLRCDLGTPGYINDRYVKLDTAAEDRMDRMRKDEYLLKRKKENNDKWNDKIDFQRKLFEINNSLGQIKRTKNLYEYEERVNEKNKIGNIISKNYNDE